MKKKLIVISAVFLFLVAGFYPQAQAKHMGWFHKGGDCAQCCSKMGRGMQGHGSSGCPIKDKFFAKVGFLKDNSKAIGLTDAQMTQIKDLKISTKKSLIKQDADIQILGIDIMSALKSDTIDVNALDKMIDQMAALKAGQGKTLVASYAQLKSILTPDQKAKAKEIWQSADSQCPMSKKHGH